MLKLSLFADDIMQYIEKMLKVSTKLLELTNEFRNFAGYRLIYRNVLLISTLIYQEDKEENNPVLIASKRMKYYRNKFNQGGKELI